MEKKAHRGTIWKVMGNEQLIRGMWEYFTLERTEVRKILAEASREKQEGIQGQWQQETAFREVLEQVKKSADADCGPEMMRRGYLAMKNGRWEDFKERYRKEGKSSEWTLERVRESHEKVAKDEIGRLGISLEILRQTLSSCGGSSRQSMEREESPYRTFFPYCNCFPLKDYNWWLSSGHGDGNNRKKKYCSWWCAACGGQNEWRAPNRILVVQLGTNANEAKVFRAYAAPQGLCDNLNNALSLLANQQKDGDSPIQSIVTGFHERSKKGIMDGVSSIMEADNHSAVDVGHLRNGIRLFFMSRSRISVRTTKRRPSGKEQMS